MHVYIPPTELSRNDLQPEELNIEIDDTCPLGRSTASDSSGERSPIKYLYANCLAFEKAIPETSRIITGRRGSGKSSLIKAIHLGCYYDIKISVEHKEFVSWVTESVNNFTNYSLDDLVDEIKYFFWFLVFQNLSKNKPTRCENIRNFLKNVSGADEEIRVISVLKAWAKKNADNKGTLLNVSSGIITAIFQENGSNFIDAKKEAKEILKGKKVVILIDSPLEIDFENKFKSDVFSALVLATSTFQPDEALIIPKYFVSTENYEKIKSTAVNWDKVEPRILALRWTPHELLLMMAKRLMFYEFYKKLNTSDSLSFINLKTIENAIEIIHKYTEKKVHNKVRDKDEDTVQYLLRHTQLTPRQVIEQGNSIWSLSLEESQNLFATAHQIRIGVSNRERHNAEDVFEWYKKQYPSAEKVCNLIFSGKDQYISYKDFIVINQQLPDTEEYSKYKNDTYYFRRMLYETGCLGVVIKKDLLEENLYIVARFESEVDGKLDVGGDNILVVHPMFVRVSGACINDKPTEMYLDSVDFSKKPVCAKSALLHYRRNFR